MAKQATNTEATAPETKPAKIEDIEKDKAFIRNIGGQKAELYLGNVLYVVKVGEDLEIPRAYLPQALIHPHIHEAPAKQEEPKTE